jgi:hypothetical protein
MQNVKMRFLLIVTISFLLPLGCFSQKRSQPFIDSVLKVADANSRTCCHSPAYKAYKAIHKTHYRYKYISVRFRGKHLTESYGPYAYGIRFYDTVNKKIYHLDDKQQREFSGTAFLVNRIPYYFPLDIDLDAQQDFRQLHTTAELYIDAWLIYAVNRHAVVPFLLIKNVKKS